MIRTGDKVRTHDRLVGIVVKWKEYKGWQPSAQEMAFKLPVKVSSMGDSYIVLYDKQTELTKIEDD